MYCLALGFSLDIKDSKTIQIIVGEIFMLINTILKFFEAYKQEGEDVYELSLSTIMVHYFKGEFKYDLFVLIPWGLVGHYKEDLKPLKILWIIKIIRIDKLFYFLDQKFSNSILRRF